MGYVLYIRTYTCMAGTLCGYNLQCQKTYVQSFEDSLVQFVGGEAIPNTGFGIGSGPILASNISCNGSEYSLGYCDNTTDIPAVCTHERDAAARCQPGFSAFNFQNVLLSSLSKCFFLL